MDSQARLLPHRCEGVRGHALRRAQRANGVQTPDFIGFERYHVSQEDSPSPSMESIIAQMVEECQGGGIKLTDTRLVSPRLTQAISLPLSATLESAQSDCHAKPVHIHFQALMRPAKCHSAESSFRLP